MQKKILLVDENATLLAAKALSKAMHMHMPNTGLSLYLEGSLGAGKTAFSRGILKAYGHSAAVKSPTYTLVEPYEIDGLSIYHFDLYRLASPEELEYMGIRDYFEGRSLRLIEWPSKGQGILPKADLLLNFTVEGTGRMLDIESQSSIGDQLIQSLNVEFVC